MKCLRFMLGLFLVMSVSVVFAGGPEYIPLKPYWKFALGKCSFAPAPVYDDNALYTVNDVGNVFAIDYKGKKIWAYYASGPVYKAPYLYNGYLYFASKEGVVYSVEAKTGKELWKFESNENLSCTPVANNNLVVFNSKKYFFGLDILTGLELWKKPFVLSSNPKLILSKDLIIFADNMALIGMDFNTGNVVWTHKLNQFGMSELELANDKVYFIASDTLYALDATNGNTVWKSTPPGITKPSLFTKPTVSGNFAFFPCGQKLYALNAFTGALFWEINLGFITNEILALNNYIYFTDRKNTIHIYSFNEKKYKLTGGYTLDNRVLSSSLTHINGTFYYHDESWNLCSLRPPLPSKK